MARPLPTFAQIHTVQKVLYAQDRWREIKLSLASIDGIMNLQGDLATVKLTGKHASPGVAPLEGAKECDRIARVLVETRDALAHVQFAAVDKRDLMTGVGEMAKSWRARASAWRAIARGDHNVEALVEPIATHFAASLEALERVQEYLQ